MTPLLDQPPRFRPQDIDAALRRAALAARELGERTQTPVFVLREGKIVDLTTMATNHGDGRGSGTAALSTDGSPPK